jgi:phosphatidylglycerol---prolipoprotein diacylglyceryl transferase
MLTYPNIDPVAVSLGPLKVHWYGIMYLIAFGTGWWLGRKRASRANSGWNAEQVDDLVFYFALGAVLGGRIGYTLFYGLDGFLHNPLSLFFVWQGGMSFHGGLLGVLGAMWLFKRKYGHGYWNTVDFVAPLVPWGLAAGRLGNFINGELWGKVTDVPWAMAFPTGGPLPRHPSMLYELLLEGPVLFAILWLFSNKPRPTMAVSGMFALFYGLFRFLVEFVRMPDAHIGYLAFGWVTMGQVLSLPLMAVGLALLFMAYRRS